ncbi:Unknown protein sequence [Pseudomonas coronafaciens pv. oryzae]|nr:Unknown protein sequence [Pseudomonas coronafaciens pv. oryzae]
MQVASLCIKGLRKLKVDVCLSGMVFDNPGKWIVYKFGRRLDRHFKFR